MDHKGIGLDELLAQVDKLFDQHPVGYPKLKPEENRRLIRGYMTQAWVAGPKMTQWVRTTVYYATRLALLGMEASDSECTVFWLRLHGLFGEVRDGLAKQLNAMEEFIAKLPISEELRQQLPLLLQVDSLKSKLATVNKAFALFSEDELLYLKARRDVEAHVWQNYYHPYMRGTKELVTRRRVFGVDWDVDVLHERIRQVLLKHDSNVLAVAVGFARRLQPVMLEVTEAFELVPRMGQRE